MYINDQELIDVRKDEELNLKDLSSYLKNNLNFEFKPWEFFFLIFK